MSRRAVSGSLTRIGTWRSDSENLALFWSISPCVAMRIAWLSAVVVTPSCAARSSRGVTMISGRRMSAVDARGDHRIELAHLLDHGGGGATEQFGVGAREHHRDRTSGAAARPPPWLFMER